MAQVFRWIAASVLFAALGLWPDFSALSITETTRALKTPFSSRYCRIIHPLTKKPMMCPEENFDDFACMVCYATLYAFYIKPEFLNDFILANNDDCYYGMRRPNGTLYPNKDIDFKNESSAIYKTIASERGIESWHHCCEAARKCCQHMLDTPTRASGETRKFCPRTFDGWQCFDDTAAGEIHTSLCESHSYSKVTLCPHTLARQCGDNGTWPQYSNWTGSEYTDYIQCAGLEPLKIRHQTHVGAFAVSLSALLPALIIFFSYKQLRLPRFTLHKNLFISLVINAIVVIVFKYLVVLTELDISSDSRSKGISGIACRFLFILTKYTRTTNFMWMFCEGFYLHRLIVAAFSEQKSFIMYYIIGWGIPIIPPAIYTIWRASDDEADIRCWGHYPIEKFEWVVNAPNVISLVINLLMLLNIIRVLVTKLRTVNTNDPHTQYKKAVRATAVLIPLFGLHLFVTMYNPEGTMGCTAQDVYYYVLYLVDGLQGFLVALIFCYLNGEVQFQLRRSFRQWRKRNQPEHDRRRRLTATAVSTVMSTSTYYHQSPPSDESGQEMHLKQFAKKI